ncbi:MAG: spore coat protein, partial [Treponema sp.]|nr:spore coat protein [Treponema sp.]
VIRATGDNPFVFSDAASALNAQAMALNADYSGFFGLPYGAGIESVNASALFRAEIEAVEKPEREHVCPYLYNHPEIFSLHRPLAPLRWQGADIRITIDTQEDFDRAQELFSALQDEPYRYQGQTITKKYSEIFC